jgi:ligand-binding sensor domain-containing protein
MSNRIQRYVERGVRPFHEVAALRPEPAHAGWTTFAARRAVRAVAVAPRSGRLWLATWGGVLSWDRKRESVCHRYGSEHGLAGNAAACLCLDAEERPWVGHAEGGLSHFDGGRWRACGGLRDEPVRALCPAPGGGVWAATAEAVYHVPAGDGPPVPVAEGDDGAVEAAALLADEDAVLLGNAWGLYRLRPGHAPECRERQRVRACRALARDGRGAVWAATPEGVYRLTKGECEGPFAPDEGGPAHVTALAAGQDQVWVLTTTGLARVAGGRWQTLARPGGAGRESRPLRALAARPEDAHVWLGSDDGPGVAWWDGQQLHEDFDLLPPDPEDALNNLGRCVAADPGDGRVFVGTAGGLVTFRPGGDWALAREAGDVRQLAAAGGHLYLLAWPRGVGRLSDPGQVEFLAGQPPGVPLALAPGRDGRPHVLTTRGLWRLEDDGRWQVRGGPEVQALCLAEAADGAWWLGTSRGVYRLVEGSWELAGEQPGPLQAAVAGLVVLGDTLWAATESGLWARRGGAWVAHQTAPGRDPYPVQALAPAAGAAALWLAGPDGVVRFDPAGGAAAARYTVADSGLAGRRVTGLAEAAGALWVVTHSGISRLTLG